MTHTPTFEGPATAGLSPGPGAPARFAVPPFLRRIWVLRTLSVLLVLVCWEWAGRVPVSPVFPTFLDTLAALWTMIADGSLFLAYGETLKPMAIGVFLSSLLAVTFGIGMGLLRPMEWFSLPVFVILQAAPMAAIIPLVTFIYGIGLAAKVLAVVIMSAPIIILNSYNGIRNTPPSLLEMSQSFLASRRQQVFKIILPAASGMIFAGFRLGLAQGLTGAILAELMITPTGVGDLITYFRSLAAYPEMFATIFSIVIFASVSITLLQKLEFAVFRPEQRAA
ncbi:ABC transporter permease [Inquilinus sp. CAU 1745]|uniref:ABC transporter permease n=1 Tax=Inquilinus sp. CAU 1745 TaxID=3140369 RepID=UPI00325BEEAE